MGGRRSAVARTEAAADHAAQRRDFAYKLGDVARLWRGQIDRRLKPLGLSFMQWSTLSRLSHAGKGVVQKDLAHLVGIEGPTMVGVLDRLVQADLVERRVVPRDRRANTVHLTGRGRQILRDAEKELRELREELLEGMSGTDLAVCIRVFEVVAGRAKAM